MSLTRAQWESLWNIAVKIERESRFIRESDAKNLQIASRINKEVKKIKRYIESVIGQME